MSERARFWAAMVTAALLTGFIHWVCASVAYPLGWGWCALIGVSVAALIWYWAYVWDLLCALVEAIVDGGLR